MSDTTIRYLTVDEATPITRMLTNYAFRATPPLPPQEEWDKMQASFKTDTRFIGVFEDEKALSCAGSTELTQNIRGQLFTGGGIWGVVTHPAARRKGVARTMLQGLFQDYHDRHVPTSHLYAFRESFYTRLGFTTFTQPRVAHFSPVPLQPLLKKQPGGEITLQELKEGYQDYNTFLRHMQQSVHGMAIFAPAVTAARQQSSDAWLALARVNGEVKAAMTYTIKDFKGEMEVNSFWYADIQGRYLLLEWFARHIDHVSTIAVRLQPYEHPETWWPDLDIQLTSIDAPLSRIIDLAQLNGLHVGPGRFTATIHDEYCPWNEGSYLFESVEGQLHISRVNTGSTDCTLTIQGITSLIYGTHEPASFAIRGWGDPELEVQATMLSIFSPLQPYMFIRF